MAHVGAVLGCDFCRPMLTIGSEKVSNQERESKVSFVEGDALWLPLSSQAFDAVTIAFGLRNLEKYRVGLREMFRVLKVPGYLAILEFSVPRLPFFRQVYLLYFTRILPWIGARISGREGPYSYLPQSVREFPGETGLAELLREIGFAQVDFFPLTGGIVTLTIARKDGSC
jgi:demethylmenaquinone methyltransferase/2-methoxy-6-polyprenyl-1,4-benzoquinol methylase